MGAGLSPAQGPAASNTPPEAPPRLGPDATLEARGAYAPAMAAEALTWEQFDAVDMRIGRIVAVEDFPEARRPAWKLRVDFGPEIGEKRSSAQITNYAREELVGRLVVAVVNFPPKQIGPVRSEVLVLGAYDDERGIVLLEPDGEVALGDRIG